MVVMPEYLMSTPKQNPSKPRIISEVKKNCLSKLKHSFNTPLQDFGKSKYWGQLLWNTKNSNWVLRTGEVRQGSLILINQETSQVELRQPLRELNLCPSNAPKTFCLTDSKGVRLEMFQALTEEEYEKWVRILAVELIRQTPLQNVRFLDILSIIRNKEPDKNNLRRGRSEECVNKAKEKLWEPLKNSASQNSPKVQKTQLENDSKKSNLDEIEEVLERDKPSYKKIKVRYQNSVPVSARENSIVKKIWQKTQSMNNLSNYSDSIKFSKHSSDESGISSGEENATDSIVRNLDNFSFLSVKEKKNFFESLNSESDVKGSENSPLMRSNSISNFKQTNFVSDRNRLHKRKRTKSLHDLHKTPVREMCQLFECQKSDTTTERNSAISVSQKRLQRGKRKLENLRNQITEVEDTITIVEDDIKSISEDSQRRNDVEAYAALHIRLDEENAKLERLKEEINRVVKENQRTTMKLERSN